MNDTALKARDPENRDIIRMWIVLGLSVEWRWAASGEEAEWELVQPTDRILEWLENKEYIQYDEYRLKSQHQEE